MFLSIYVGIGQRCSSWDMPNIVAKGTTLILGLGSKQ